MNICLVYVLTSSEKDIYLEQCLVSLYSLRVHNPDAEVIVLVDDKTKASIVGQRAVIEKFADDVRVVDTPADYSPVERSRFIKTQIRRFVEGDFLFLDCDTIITGPLDDIDKQVGDVAVVTDFHGSFRDYPFRDYIIDEMQRIYSLDVSDVSLYFNSGAIYCKDTPLAHKFFEKWHEMWTYSDREKGNFKDQPAMMAADKLLGGVITEMDGVWNCQVPSSIKYLSNAKVLHFFNARYFNYTDYIPFLEKSFYQKVKDEGLTDEIKYMILHPLEQFVQYSSLIGKGDFDYLSSPCSRILQKLYERNNLFYKFIEFLLKTYRKLS